ncbi:MAG: C25 family cysteine peptidase [Caldilineaceae bacterium]
MSFVLTIALLLSSVVPAYAQPATHAQSAQTASPTWRTTEQTDGVYLQWDAWGGQQSVTAAAVDAAAMDAVAMDAAAQQRLAAQLPTMRYGGYNLPMQLTTVLLPDGADATPQIQQLEDGAWSAGLVEAAPLSLDEFDLEDEYFAPIEEKVLPTAPVFVLREGRMRGQRIAVIAFSPIYAQDGAVKFAYRVGALAPKAKPLTDFPQFADQSMSLASGAPRVGGVAPAPPTNAAALQNSIKVQVAAAGLQTIAGSDLINNGIAANTALSTLQLFYRGAEVALEVVDSDGKLDAATQVRFYAHHQIDSMTVGDWWNETEFYWLTYKAGANGLRMSSRAATPGAAPLRSNALEKGIWEDNKIYESTMPGADNDHWFAAELNADPTQAGNPSLYPKATVTLNNLLPLDAASGDPSIFRLTGSARTNLITHTLEVNVGGDVHTLAWNNAQYYESWDEQISSAKHPAQLNLTLMPGSGISQIRLDKVYWQQPVQLNFQSKGAAFSSVDGNWRYQLTNTAANRVLYDVTDPLKPVILSIPGGTNAQFEDGATARDYLLSGPGVNFTPTLSKHAPVNFTNGKGADALYIAPAFLLDELAPLIALRQQQGYKVEAIDAQQIYDAWSFGQVSPEAIRSLLRYAVQNWNPAPIAATLVGDSTNDPKNYLGFRDGIYGVNLLPAYFANVDPWLVTTACEPCFGQLDDEDPLAGTTDPDFLIDIWIGRLSVQDEAQLTTVVNKIVGYETDPTKNERATWRQTSLFYAEEFMRADGTTDAAGDFAAFSDSIINEVQPSYVNTMRVYYDPRPGGVTDAWREPDAAKVRLRVINALQSGPALAAYNGHSNHWQNGSTDKSVADPYLLGFNDIYQLHNRDQLTIMLEMTCFTGQFTKTSATATVMDERFLRYEDGGAVAVWAPAGLTVAHGHDKLMTGFHKKLWNSPQYSQNMGQLTEAGYLELFTSSTCCQDARLTFLLMGDPLTTALVQQNRLTHLPITMR